MIEIEAYCCPRCHATLRWINDEAIACTNSTCIYSNDECFPVVGGQPALIDFDRSVVDRATLCEAGGASQVSRDRSPLFHFLRRVIRGEGEVTSKSAEAFISYVKEREGGLSDPSKPVVLVVGGGTIRSGARDLYDRDDISLLSFDVYASPITDFIGDGHHIALPDGSVDGVWIEAVLEHVVDPQQVVLEIHRVVKTNGLVYAETPFMQQVHEGAYDFSRFTHSGHRWLFKHFEEVSSGAVGGIGTALIWSIRYFWYGLTGNRKAGIILSLPMFWLRFLDRFSRPGAGIDAASGFYFLGRKSDQELSPKDIIDYYRGAQ